MGSGSSGMASCGGAYVLLGEKQRANGPPPMFIREHTRPTGSCLVYVLGALCKAAKCFFTVMKLLGPSRPSTECHQVYGLSESRWRSKNEWSFFWGPKKKPKPAEIRNENFIMIPNKEEQDLSK